MCLWNSNLLSVCQMVWSVIKMTASRQARSDGRTEPEHHTHLYPLVCTWDLSRLNFFFFAAKSGYERFGVSIARSNNRRGKRNNRDREKEENQPGNIKAEANVKQLVREQLYKTVRRLETKLWKVRIKQAEVKASKTASERDIYKTAGEQQQSTNIIELLLHIDFLNVCISEEIL